MKKYNIKNIIYLILCLFLLTSCNSNTPEETSAVISLEEQIQQTEGAVEAVSTPEEAVQDAPITQDEGRGQTDEGKVYADPSATPAGREIVAAKEDSKMMCTLSIRCDAVYNDIKRLDKDKIEILPQNGIIMQTRQVEFFEGESVFNLLQRETKKNKIHMEFMNAPLYNSGYIEGIGNLYEYDCGELSGWMYKVNGRFPNYGCGGYTIEEGDVIEWVYTCDLGRDVGNEYAGADYFDRMKE